MKIGIISDTHGNVSIWNKVISEFFNDVNLILHAGDILAPGPKNPIKEGYSPPELANAINNSSTPIIISKGNCDSDVDDMLINIPISNPYSFVHIDGMNILILHGHKYNLQEISSRYKINLCISGHTHESKLEKIKNTIFCNPGSPSVPLDGIPSVGILENNNIKIINIETKEIIKKLVL